MADLKTIYKTSHYMSKKKKGSAHLSKKLFSSHFGNHTKFLHKSRKCIYQDIGISAKY